MDLKQIEKLMTAMEESLIKRVVIKQKDFEIEIEREGTNVPGNPVYVSSPVYTSAAPAVEQKRSATESQPALEKKENHPGALHVTSPMVGTFYGAPSPDDPSFVKVGDAVREDTVVCIIEAMKVMNEVKAGVKGTIAAVLVKSGEPVEFGTQIFRITPS